MRALDFINSLFEAIDRFMTKPGPLVDPDRDCNTAKIKWFRDLGDHPEWLVGPKPRRRPDGTRI